eukprot:6150900-Pyramimonas_sp.AAC.1
MARPMAKLIVNLCWNGWRKPWRNLNRHSKRKSSSSLLLAPPLPSSDPFVLIFPRYPLPFVFKGFTSHAWQGMNIPPKGGAIEYEKGGQPGFGIYISNDARADLIEQS